MSKRKGLVWVGVTVAIAVVAALGLPGLAKRIPWSVERRLGSIGGEPLEGDVCRGLPAGGNSLKRLVARLYPVAPGDAAVPVSIAVIRGDTVNAYAALGGKIYVFDGLLQQAQSAEELAGILAHEIEHVRARHIIQGMVVSLVTWGGLKMIFQTGDSSMTRLMLSMGFSRVQEAEADEGGLERLRSAGVNAAGFAKFFERARESGSAPSILSSHPADAERAARAARFTGYPTRPVLTAGEWSELRGICRE